MEKEMLESVQAASLPDAVILRSPSRMPKSLIWVMSISAGVAVANLYYVQPLLASMARDLHVSASQIGIIATLSQIGYTIGLLFIVPLGDKFNQRTLIVSMALAVALSIICMALAPTMLLLGIASLLLGLTTVVPQLLLPYAASLAPDAMRGRVVGSVMTGLLIGILVARTVSGFIAATLGWRAVYWMAAGLMLLLALTLRMLLPADPSSRHEMSYLRLLRSLWDLIRDEPVLRETSAFGALTFAAFSAFWVTLSFLLETPPYHFGSEVAGLFGLVGVAGALAASFVGKLADRRDPRFANGVAMGITLLSFVLMWLAGQWLPGLVVGVILLDLGTQGNQVTNQTRIYALNPLARSRLNTCYMVLYFVGGSLGSLLGTIGWSVAGWNGVCLVSCLFLLSGVGIFFLNNLRRRSLAV